jgi:hypothetical protein
MFKYYCILAHTNPEQVKNLVIALNDEFSKFYIHIDKNCEINLFKEIITGTNILFINKRYESNWGSIGIVLATIEIFKTVISNENKNEKGFFLLLSGSDYPLKSNKFITNFLIKNYDYNFIDISPINVCWSENEIERRLNQYSFFKSNNRNKILSIPPVISKGFYKNFYKNLKKIYELIKSDDRNDFFLLLKKRKNRITSYGGSQWITLNKNTVKIILEWISNNPNFLKFHKFTFVPDEFFFQSIIKSIDNIKIKKSLTYVNWTRKNVELPVVFKSHDISELKLLDENVLFARKFNILKDKEIIKKIELTLRK